MQVSVILSTRNRAAQLSRCLDELDHKAFAALPGEIVLVDHASTDDTQAVMARFAARSMAPVRIVRATRPGLGAARNTGLAVARGDILVMLDDDCTLAPDYPGAVLRALEDQAVAVVGGRILLVDPEAAQVGVQMGETRERYSAARFATPGAFQAANLAFRRSVIARIGGFDERLGAGTQFRCEDIEFVARALEAGFVALHEPAAVVHHDHGRARGPEENALRRLNDRAAGTYFAIVLGRTGPRHLRAMLRYARRELDPARRRDVWAGMVAWWRRPRADARPRTAIHPLPSAGIAAGDAAPAVGGN